MSPDYVPVTLPRSYRDQLGHLRTELVRRRMAGEALPQGVNDFLAGEVCPYCGSKATPPHGRYRYAACTACNAKWQASPTAAANADEFLKALGVATLVGLGLWALSEMMKRR